VTEHGYHPQRLDLTVHAGDPIDEAIPVLDGLGAAVSLAGWSAAAVAETVDGTVLHTFTPTIVSDQIRVAATSAQTRAWNWSVYAARLTVTGTPPAGSPITLGSGWIRFYPH
jgi:hypothetical protein